MRDVRAKLGWATSVAFFGLEVSVRRPSVRHPYIRVTRRGKARRCKAMQGSGGNRSSFWEGKVQFQCKLQEKPMRSYQLAHGGCACGLELRNFGRLEGGNTDFVNSGPKQQST